MDALTDFTALELPIPVKKALAHQNITTPTPIQAEAIPHAMAGKDVVGLAQTGTGKTLAFCLPLVTALDKEEFKDASALILAPTREIAIQVTEVIKHLTAKMTGRWHPVLVIGGVGMQPQIDGLKKQPRFIIATPGRLVDHMREGHAQLDHVKFLVLDEADRMLDMGFAPQLNEVLRGLPSERQTLLFSATFPNEIADISRKYLRDPVRVEVGPGHSRPVDSVTQVTKEMNEDDKLPTLLEALNERQGTVLVFVRTKHRADRISRQLEKHGHAAGRIHGDRSQAQRQAALSAFREGKMRILVATDIAARGIDVPDVGHVINYDIPNVPEEYIHRIGRTGRAGATGQALSFLTPEVREEWRAILKLIDPELYKNTPKVANAPRPDPRAPRGPRAEGRREAAPQQNPGQRPARRDHGRRDGQPAGGQRRERHHEERDQRGNRGGYRQHASSQQAQRHPSEDRDNRGNRAFGQAPDNFGNGGGNWDEPEDMTYEAQPSLEDQLTRIDMDGRDRMRAQRRDHRGGQANGGNQRRGGQGGGQKRKWEAPKKHPYARGNAQGGQAAQPRAGGSAPEELPDDNIGNRAGAGGDDPTKKSSWGIMGWFKK